MGQNSEGFGRHLNGLFKQAITAGKRVRAETKIASGAVSVSSAAAELAALKLPTQQLQDAKVRAESECLAMAQRSSRDDAAKPSFVLRWVARQFEGDRASTSGARSPVCA